MCDRRTRFQSVSIKLLKFGLFIVFTFCVFLSGLFVAFRYPHLSTKTSIVNKATGWVLNCNHKIHSPTDAKPIAIAFLNRALVVNLTKNNVDGFLLGDAIELVSESPDQANIFVVNFTTSKVINGVWTNSRGELSVTECGRVVDYDYPK